MPGRTRRGVSLSQSTNLPTQHDIGASNQQKRGSSVRFLPNFCSQGCLCNPTEASTRHPSCAYCAESQRPTIHEGEQAPSKREPSPGEQGPSPDDTGLPKTTSPQGDIPTRGCRGTGGGPPPTRQLNHCHSIGAFLLYDPGFARRCTPRRIACLPRANGTKLPQALSCTDRELL